MSRFIDKLRGIFTPSAAGRTTSRDGSLDTLSLEEYFRGEDAWTGVQSSNVHSIAYYGQGPAGGVLGVRFRNKKNLAAAGSEYHYYGVPYEIYAKMIDAGSKGKFVWTDLRDRYSYKRIWVIR